MDVGGSFNRALERFKPNAVPLIVGLLIVGGINVVINGVVGGVLGVVVAGSTVGTMALSLILALIAMTLTGPLYGGFLTLVGKTVMGATPEIGDVFAPLKGGRLKEFVIAGAVIQSPQLLGVVPVVGGLLAGLGGIATNFLFFFAILMVAEGADGKTALMRSKELVLANVKTVVILFFVMVGLSVAGVVALLVGLLVTIPIATLMYVETYLQLKSGQPVGIQPMPGGQGGYDPNQQQQYQQPPPGGGYPQG